MNCIVKICRGTQKGIHNNVKLV